MVVHIQQNDLRHPRPDLFESYFKITSVQIKRESILLLSGLTNPYQNTVTTPTHLTSSPPPQLMFFFQQKTQKSKPPGGKSVKRENEAFAPLEPSFNKALSISSIRARNVGTLEGVVGLSWGSLFGPLVAVAGSSLAALLLKKTWCKTLQDHPNHPDLLAYQPL